MLAVSGIVVNNGRVLLCRRRGGTYYGGSWEFPTFEIEDGETAEDSLERNFFDCLSVQVFGLANLGAVSMESSPFVRFFLYSAEISGNVRPEGTYNRCKWLKIKELARFRQSFACVTAINALQNL